jgi:hypothetical protein
LHQTDANVSGIPLGSVQFVKSNEAAVKKELRRLPQSEGGLEDGNLRVPLQQQERFMLGKQISKHTWDELVAMVNSGFPFGFKAKRGVLSTFETLKNGEIQLRWQPCM